MDFRNEDKNPSISSVFVIILIVNLAVFHAAATISYLLEAWRFGVLLAKKSGNWET